MKSSQKTPVSVNLIENGVIPKATLAYLSSRTKNRLYDFILRKFIEKEKSEGLTKAELARRIGKKPEVISRLLGAPGNWEIETVAELLAGIAQEELQPNSVPLNLAPSNYRYQPWVADFAASGLKYSVPANVSPANAANIKEANIAQNPTFSVTPNVATAKLL